MVCGVGSAQNRAAYLIKLSSWFCWRSRIIVMDEATAAVDGDTDQLIQTAMRSVFYNCTVLTIAHRIDTIIDCDRVLVLAKGGRLAEYDTPANLLRRAGAYLTYSLEWITDTCFIIGNETQTPQLRVKSNMEHHRWYDGGRSMVWWEWVSGFGFWVYPVHDNVNPAMSLLKVSLKPTQNFGDLF